MEVRDVHGDAEMRACQALQRRAWGIVEDGYVVPVATMVAVQKFGGLVLGAFDGPRLLGFSFAFLGCLRGEVVLYSQLTAVEPGTQGQGVGRALKLEQRRRARAAGLRRIAWAFDPLQAPNAWFNLGVLGAVSRTYERDLYGARSDSLNAGLATDRLVAEWDTAEERAPARERFLHGVDLLVSEPAYDGGPRRPGEVRPLPGDDRPLHIEAPADLAAARARSGLAQAWQSALREALETAFAAGYLAVGFVRGERPCYLLARPT